MSAVIMGALAMGFTIAGLFFLRFWRETRDRLFAFFAVAFFILAAGRVGFAFYEPRSPEGDYLYWVRLSAFALILAAIIDKNLFSKPAGPPSGPPPTGPAPP
jgi:hypothetical protein